MPTQPGKEFEIKKRLDRLRGITENNNNNSNNNNNNNNNNGGGSNDLFSLDRDIPTEPSLNDFLDGPPPPAPPQTPIFYNDNINLFEQTPPPPPASFNQSNVFENVWTIRQQPSNFNNTPTIGNNLFVSQAAIAVKGEKTKTQAAVDDFLYELPEDIPDLELGDILLEILGVNAEDLISTETPALTKEEEEDEILKKLKDEYGLEDIKNTMEEEGEVPESIYFVYGGESENFVKALEFIGLSPINREFGAFLLSDIGRQVMTENKLSIHVESGDVFYNNHNMGQNFYNFLFSQQNDNAAFVPKKFSYQRSFESYISNFVPAFSIDDQEKFNLLAFKNSKYLFYLLTTT